MRTKTIFFILVFCWKRLVDRDKNTTNCIPIEKIKKKEKIVGDKIKQDNTENNFWNAVWFSVIL